MLRSARHRCLAVTLAIAFAAPLSAPAQQQQQAAARYELNLPEQELADALRALAKAARVNIAFDPTAVAALRREQRRTHCHSGQTQVDGRLPRESGARASSTRRVVQRPQGGNGAGFVK